MASSWPAKLSSSSSVRASRASRARWATSSREIWDTTTKPSQRRAAGSSAAASSPLSAPPQRSRAGMPSRAAVQQCCACLRICCGSSWRIGRAASARWPWRSARWAPTSCRWTWSSAASGYAIDDLVVDLPPGAMPDMLITAAENAQRRPGGQHPAAHRAAGGPPRAGADRPHRRGTGQAGQAAGARRRGAAGAAGRLVHGVARLTESGI